jgi:cysteinyl-tRNA synthetase
MSKSLRNFYVLGDIVKKGYDPLSLRYLFLTSHYRDSINFIWEALRSAENTLRKIRKLTLQYKEDKRRVTLSEEKRQKIEKYSNEFVSHMENDLDTPKAMAVMWKMLKSNIPSIDKYDLLLSFDEILGLNLRRVRERNIPEEVLKLAEKRKDLREGGKFKEADKVREEINSKGFNVKDTKSGFEIEKLNK